MSRQVEIKVVSVRCLPLGSGIKTATLVALVADRIAGGMPWWGFALVALLWLVWFANACTLRKETAIDIFEHKK